MAWTCAYCGAMVKDDVADNCSICLQPRRTEPHAAGTWYIRCPRCRMENNVDTPDAHIDVCPNCGRSEIARYRAKQRPAIASFSPAETYLHFQALQGPSPFQSFAFDVFAQGAVLGREGDCAAESFPVSVSGQHCRIGFDEGWYAEDLNSRNGTILNGKMIAEKSYLGISLSRPLLFQMADVVFKVELRERATASNE